MITFTFGPPPKTYDPIYTGYFMMSVQAALEEAVSEKSANQRVLLQSPNKTLYSLSVDDAGNLKVSKVDKNR